MNRWLLLVALPLIPVLVAPCGLAQTAPAPAVTSAQPRTAPRNVSAAEFERMLQGTNVVVLDVRTPAEFEGGHLPKAVLLDYRAPDFTNKVARLDRSKTYLVHCAGGVRSSKACVSMISLGFTNVVNLEGGLGAWQEAGKPLQE
ncbi:MAG: rhodanese-like domain-containing protein [Verrucomicrobia bacterium]|nr:rhodanese-like domain-containing protein [Verrucomicrobiota bacterium]